MKILFIGDIFGKPGRNMVAKHLKSIKEKYHIDFSIVNAENSAHGKGLTKKQYLHLMESGVDFITMGNHTWFRTDILELLTECNNIIRPLNLKPEHNYSDIGDGSKEITINNKTIRITNLLGNSVRFNNLQKNCFKAFDNLLEEVSKPDIHIVDLHAETTSEKNAFLWNFDGQISAVLGTHTHIPTLDSAITKKGTAFVSDVGMTGPSCGVIGGEKTSIIKKFKNPETTFILDVEQGPQQLCGTIIEFDETTNLPIDIEQLIIKEGFQKLGRISYLSE